MKKIMFAAFMLTFLAGCAGFDRLMPIFILYDNITYSIVTDKILVHPPTNDNNIIPVLATRLNDFTKTEIEKQGNLKITSSCGPRTMKIVQDITGYTINSVTNVSTGFLPFFIIRGQSTATTGDNIIINTTASIIDCESGKILRTYNYSNEGPNPVDVLQDIAWYNVNYAYKHRRGLK
jgi:hypothetical protein